MENIIREIERCVYLTISAIKLKCVEDGNFKAWIAVNEIARRCSGLPHIQQNMKPQA